jgi:hypothetical protein
MLSTTNSCIIRLIKGLIFTLIAIGLSACGSDNLKTDSAHKAESFIDNKDVKDANSQSKMEAVKEIDSKHDESEKMTITGQIRYLEFEGGFYGFIANNGDKYMPSGLKNEYRRNGLIVEMKVEPIPDMMTIQQFGILVKVLEIKVIDATKVTDKTLSM